VSAVVSASTTRAVSSRGQLRPYKTRLDGRGSHRSVSATYGTADRTAGEIILPSIYGTMRPWRPSPVGGFGTFSQPVRFSTSLPSRWSPFQRLDSWRGRCHRSGPADAEGPQRELELQKKQEREGRLQQEKPLSTDRLPPVKVAGAGKETANVRQYPAETPVKKGTTWCWLKHIQGTLAYSAATRGRQLGRTHRTQRVMRATLSCGCKRRPPGTQWHDVTRSEAHGTTLQGH